MNFCVGCLFLIRIPISSWGFGFCLAPNAILISNRWCLCRQPPMREAGRRPRLPSIIAPKFQFESKQTANTNCKNRGKNCRKLRENFFLRVGSKLETLILKIFGPIESTYLFGFDTRAQDGKMV